MKLDTIILQTIFSYIERITAFLVSAVIFLFALYVFGGYQNFMDQTQFHILKSISGMSIFLSITSLIFFLFVFFVKLCNKQLREQGNVHSAFFAVAFIIAVLMAIFSMSVATISMGI